MKLLIPESPLQVLPSLAIRVGLNEAIVLQQLHYLTLKLKQPPELTLQELREESFPFWTTRTIQRATRTLAEAALLSKEQKKSTDRRIRYVVEYEAIERLTEGEEDPAAMTTDCRDGRRQLVAVDDDTSSASTTPDRRDVLQEEAETAERLRDVANAPSLSQGVESSPKGSDSTPRSSEKKPTAAERDENPVYLELAQHLAGKIAGVGSKPPTESQIRNWRSDVRRMVELDKREVEKIRAAIDWAFAQPPSGDGFLWAAVLESMGAVRRHYDKRRLKAQAQKRGGGGQAPPPTKPNLVFVEGYGHVDQATAKKIRDRAA